MQKGLKMTTGNQQNFLTVAQAEKDKSSSSLWVLNNSGNQGSLKQKGVINISIPEGNGQVNTIRVPITFIPIDLTTQATKNAVLSNPQFRRLVQGGLLRILSADHAEELLQSPDAQEEQRRIFSLGSADELQPLQETAPEQVKNIIQADQGTISGYALNLAHNSDGNEDDLVASLKANASTLTTEELKYIVNNSIHAKVKTEAAMRIVK